MPFRGLLRARESAPFAIGHPGNCHRAQKLYSKAYLRGGTLGRRPEWQDKFRIDCEATGRREDEHFVATGIAPTTV
jgi:hypothetical protein